MAISMRSLPGLAVALMCLALIGPKGFGQTLPGPGTEGPAERPYNGAIPTGSYTIGQTESVENTTGNVSLGIPLAELPSLGNRNGFKLTLNYNSAFYNSSLVSSSTFAYYYDPSNQPNQPSEVYGLVSSDELGWDGWSYSYQYALEEDIRSCEYPGSSGGVLYTTCYRYILRTGDGGSHALWLNAPNDNDNFSDGYSYICSAGRHSVPPFDGTRDIGPTLVYHTTDGSFIRVEVSNGGASWIASFPDGRTVSNNGNRTRIADPNGTVAFVDRNVDLSNARISTVISDDFGRSIRIDHEDGALHGRGPIQDVIHAKRAKGVAGVEFDQNDLTTTVDWATKLVGFNFNHPTNPRAYQFQCHSLPPHVIPPVSDILACHVRATLSVVSQITLPNGRKYSFEYADDSAGALAAKGELRKVYLPAASEANRPTAEYTWARLQTEMHPSSDVEPRYANINPVTHKTVSWTENGQARSEQWLYAIGSDTSTVTNPDGGVTTYGFNPHGVPGWSSGLVYYVKTPTEEIRTCWRMNVPWIGVGTWAVERRNPYIALEYRKIRSADPQNHSTTTAASFTYDMNGNLVERKEYDWADTFPNEAGACTLPASSPIRSISYTHWAPPRNSGGSRLLATEVEPLDLAYKNAQNAYWSMSAPVKRDSVLDVRVAGGTAANPTALFVQSVTQFEYDNHATTGNVTRQLEWNSVLRPSVPPVAVTAVTLSGSSDSAVTQHSYATGAAGQTVPTQTIVPGGLTTTYEYNSSAGCGQYLYVTTRKVAPGLGEQTQSDFEYDCASGLLMGSVNVSNGNVESTFDYDRYGRVTSAISAAEQTSANRKSVIATEYDDVYDRVRVVANGTAATVTHYNQLGEATMVRSNGDADMTPIPMAGETGIVSIASRKRVNTAGSEGTYVLASNPHVVATASTEETMGWTVRRFDQGGRLLEVYRYRGAGMPPPFGTNSALTGKVTYSYKGRVTEVSDEAGKVTSTEADALGRIASATNPAGTTSYTYNALDNLTGVTQSDAWTYGSQKTQTRTYTYNSLGWLLTAQNPESGTVSYGYFADGSLKTRTDARSVTLTHTLDALGRVVKTDYSATDPVTPNLRFCYDGKEYNLASDSCVTVSGRSDYARGALTHAVARKVVSGTPTLVSGTKYTSIDPLGRVLESRQTTGTLSDYTFLYQYAVGGALAKVRYPSGNWVSYDVNGANRISQVRKGETGNAFYMKNAAYNAAGALVGATLGLDGANQWTETRGYNSRLQARRVEVAKGTDTLLRLRWAYSAYYNDTTFEETSTDNNGDLRVERLEFPHQGAPQTVDRTYAYTGADRLSYFMETGGKNQYFGYDAFGNVWQTYVSGVPSLRQTGSSWYLQGGVVNNRLANTIYDAAGNQTQLSAAAGTVASFDGENRMSKIAAGGSEKALYTYDAEGRRVAKTVNGATTTYYFYDAAGQLMAEYGGPAETAATQYFTTDHLGSTRLILNGTGACLDRLDYAPFGGQISRSGYDCYGGASSEKPLFTGQMRDGESTAGTDTGQDYFNARYLWANIARFTSPDPENASAFLYPDDPQSWNGYSYGRNNPLLYVDPDGMNYRVCDTEGHCRDNVTDEEWNKWREAQGKNIIVTAGGNILDRETEKKIGSAQYYNEKLAETLQDAGNRADVLIKDAAKTMAVNAAMTATGVIALRGLSYAAQSAQELGIFKNTKVLVNFAHNLMNVRPGHIPPPGGMAEAQSAVEGAIRTGNYLMKGNRLFEGTTQINGVAVGFRGRFVDGVARVATVFTKR